ncbi:MAG: 16S rRNA (adenine(1518)-N(6)/adenine(1519)-N(6))-dimethyltransferase RsmA [Candidatus Aenigmatarchaeota archaeon]
MTSRRRRSLGQHFLRNTAVAERMAEYADIGKNDVVLEIGPGKGALTEILATRAKKVIVIEKDTALAEALEGRWPNVEIIIGDALRTEWPNFDKVVASLPFIISGPFTSKLMEHKFKTAVLLYQREFAYRIVASPGDSDWSRLTVMVKHYCDVELMEKIARGNFNPPPEVDCAIVRLKPKQPDFETDKFYWLIVAKLFQHRRKLVRAALKHVAGYDTCGMDADGFVPFGVADKRVYECSPEDFRQIADVLREHLGSG